MKVIEIIDPGPLCTVQDLGRSGYADLGVGHSGAADVFSFRLANRLVGNIENAAGLEATLGGLTVRFRRPATIALTGARTPATVDGRPVGLNGPLYVSAGSCLVLGVPVTGLRTYVAVRGGIAVPTVLGSRATDLLSGLGPKVPEPGDVLPVGDRMAGWPVVDHAPVRPAPVVPVLRLTAGPRDDWFTPAAMEALFGQTFEVTPESNRIGARLTGPVLGRSRAGELPSEGLVPGAVQVPPDGRPVLFLADHPVTGGYPVIGVVRYADVPLAAQLRPGERLTFRKV